ncbi:Dolichol-phosphate mannosyltransferase in lipid-linked oligosaccharide synthesis cluster [hydrothermal vent metagenome]|uniref:Dolichol-phosphate mannosyltransferase in lipid-linked oligosaccharide synthesis cluster n=1 Tax=hydrothermal vent metagenome TaxID=652676 RepID=A0A3B1CA76_9ZZZZ
MNSKSLVIIPTYNEIENIEPLIHKIHGVLPEISILVIDDNSCDGTAEMVEKIKSSDSRVDLIRRPEKLGLGTAYITGFKYAIEKGYDFIFEMDGDFSHDPVYLPAFLTAAKEADLVIGSRYIPGGGVVNWSFFRRLISIGGSIYSRLILSMPYKDLTGGFKCFRREALMAIPLDDVFSEGYSFQIEMTYRAHKKGMRIREIPIIFKERVGGKSKMSKKIFIEAIFRVWQIKLTSL